MTKLERQTRLLEWSDSYYNESISLVPDHVYDAEYDAFAKDYPDDPFLKTVGSPVDRISAWKKATHKIPMGSLNKVTNEDEFNKWVQSTNTNEVILSEKLDGISIDLEYENGKLVKAITRGDGFIGEDITKNVLRMQNVVSDFGKELHPITGRERYTIVIRTFTGAIRGEVILKQSDFESIVAIQTTRLEEPLKNMRNGAAGIAKKHNGKYAEYLSIGYFDITGEFETKLQKFEAIENMGLPTSLVGVYDISDRDIVEIVKKYEDDRRAKLDYEIDGLVVDVNDTKQFNALGELHKKPKGAVAYKFGSIKKDTRILSVTWQLGKSGTITPVAELDPVKMGGVTVKRASLHNLENFKKLDLHFGDVVLVSRRNDVIPYVEKVVLVSKGFGIPIIKTCPVCDTIAVESGKFLVCPNVECDGAKIGGLRKWTIVTGMQSLGIGGKTLEKLYEFGLLYQPEDLYTLEVEEIEVLDGFGKRSAEKIVNIIQSKRELPLSEFIGGLNIRNFSTSMVELLVEYGYDTLDKLLDLDRDALVRIKGIEDKTATAFLNGIQTKKNIINGLLDVGIIIKKENTMTTQTISDAAGKVSGMSFCFTGAVQAVDENGDRYKRSMLESLVQENGGMVKNVVAGLTYLVQADPESQSSKTKKAENLGVAIISDVEFLSMVK